MVKKKTLGDGFSGELDLIHQHVFFLLPLGNP